jgi:hypothetical protein
VCDENQRFDYDASRDPNCARSLLNLGFRLPVRPLDPVNECDSDFATIREAAKPGC